MALAAPTAAVAQTLRIITSLPPSLTDPLIAGFRDAHPGIEVLVLNKNTNSALSEVIRGNSRQFDIFWVSAPEPFALIKARSGFSTTGCEAAGTDGYVPFAFSSIGWARRSGNEVFMPGTWDDLLLPAYRGKIGMALPSRSGTSHMMVERFLQVRGWEEGWSFLLALSQNLATLSARSFGVIEGIEAGRFDIGLTIDFLAQTQSGLDFRYGQPVMVFPAQIGLLTGGGQPVAACDFLGFVTSDQGQRILLQPEVGRIPASPAIRDAAGDAIPDALDLAIHRSWQGYDAELAQARYWSVNMIFELFIADLLPRRRNMFARIDALEGAVEAAELASLRRELSRVPIAETEALPSALNANPGYASDLIRMNEAQQEARQRWAAAAKAQLDAVDLALTRLEAPKP
ncbi:ABC transporter substrate-binding protein [Paracoccus fistulariae]|uniref:Substrate-binding domain-containing protein n=1 Tax=Paracoccus fistulariae TaxID=658446 RepID=A0ABY7SIU0_9RHOB|nr:substrate-binding domain-containing protein [Paracoccus fistulariae]MDB6180868.1 substrate-binding domain-containing protein [Paracoccus fistulariae]WCR06916.1 substrate-binding domain-containing protein [Paracoccus fistulariae]